MLLKLRNMFDTIVKFFKYGEAGFQKLSISFSCETTDHDYNFREPIEALPFSFPNISNAGIFIFFR